jgi:hypothetical protein
MTSQPKFSNNSIVNGKNYGTFAIFGSRFSELVGEWIYEVRQVNDKQEIISRGMNMVESSFA